MNKKANFIFMIRMLKILVIMLLSSLAVKSQIFIRPNNSYGVTYNRLRADSSLLFATYCGVPVGTAGLHSINQKMSALYYDSCGHKLYVFDPSDSTWSIAGSGALSRFGIEDATSSTDRYNNMKGNAIEVDSASAVILNSMAGGNTSSLLLAGNAFLSGASSTDGTSINVYPDRIDFPRSISTKAAKLVVYSSDSLIIPSPSSIAAWQNDTLKAISISDLSSLVGGGGGGGVSYKFSSAAPTGADTLKLWIKTPDIAGVYDVLTYVSNTLQYPWQRFGWLTIDGFFSNLPPVNIAGGGQSNMGGIYPGGDTARVPGILAFTSGASGDGDEYQTHWEQAAIGKSPFFGANNNMAFQFAKNLRIKERRIVRIVLTYKGGVNLSAWLCGSPHYLLDTLRSRLTRSGIDTLQVFLWHHGESNGCANTLAGGYYKDMQDFYDTLCSPATTGFKRNVTQFIAGELGGLDAANRYSQFKFTEANGAIRALNYDGNLNTASVVSYGLSRCDDTHFCGTALDSMGLRMYGAYKTMPHTVAYEQRLLRGNFDTTYEKLVYDEADNLLPASGGGYMYKYYKNSFAWSTNGINTLSVDENNTVNINNGHTLPLSNYAAFKVNGGGAFVFGQRNLLLSSNFNVDNSGGGIADNVVLANYTSSWTGAVGTNSVLIGSDVGYYPTRMPNNSVYIGWKAAYNFQPAGTGDLNVIIGAETGLNGSGLQSTIVGARSGQYGGVSNVTLMGFGINPAYGIQQCTGVGANTIVDSSYQVALGDTNQVQLKVGKLRFKLNITPANGDTWVYDITTHEFKPQAPASGGITSINSQTGSSQTIAAGTGINVSSSGNTHTISATGDFTSGGIKANIHVVNDADYTVASTDYAILYSALSADRTLTLPSASSSTNRVLLIRQGSIASRVINLNIALKENTGVTVGSLGFGESVTIVSDGTDWWIVAHGT